jgi:hypothetical protein
MKKTISLLSNLLLSSTLFWAVPSVNAEIVGGQEIVKEPMADANYCHMKFPPIRENTLSWEQPVFNEAAGNIIDYYGPCDHDPLGREEVEAQRRVLHRGYFEDGSGSD